MKLKFTNLDSAGLNERITLLCPHCKTLCHLILRFFSLSKRTNGLFWKCEICPFELKVDSKEGRDALGDFLAETLATRVIEMPSG